jgi:hypothetical protein
MPGDDWELFAGAAQRVLSGNPIYGQIIVHDYYFNPPWVAVLLIPLALLPHRVGLAVLSTLTLFVSLLLLHRWLPKPGYIKPILMLLSPPIFYILIHGQIDTLILLGIFLPVEWWWLVAISKPQITLGLAAGVPPRLWIRAGVITFAVLAASLLLFGNWISQVLFHPLPLIYTNRNVWNGLWPFQVPVGLALLVLGYSRSDERLFVASSPLLVPYAALSSFLGAWIGLLTFLKDWQAVIVWLSWWAAVAYRGLVN